MFRQMIALSGHTKQQLKSKLQFILAAGLFFFVNQLLALSFNFNPNSNIVGQIQFATVESGDNIYSIARQYDVGPAMILAANPGVSNTNLKAGQKLIIPTAFVLPNTPRTGIVINLPELRLYYFPPGQSVVLTFPIGIGRDGWETPVTETTVMTKVQDPFWYPPESIREYTLKTKGKELPKAVPPGPDNPLGSFAIYLSLESYLIHGTNQPQSVGQRSSSGCIRMYPEDIAELFPYVQPGTPVYIIHEPYKVGIYQSELYLESHDPLAGYITGQAVDEEIRSLVVDKNFSIDWPRAHTILEKHLGYPILIGKTWSPSS